MEALNNVVKDYQDSNFEICECYEEVILTRKVTEYTREKVQSSTKCYNVLHPWFMPIMETQEQFVVIYLDNSLKVNLIQRLSLGGITSTSVDIRLIVSTALLSLSTHVMIAHNHPSGNTQPSSSDKIITNRLKEALSLFDITLLDHVILTATDYYSFADEGIL